MKFNLERNERTYRHVEKLAIDKGFTREEIEEPYLSKLSHQTKSKRILRMISLAYYLGWLRGIRCVDNGYTEVTISTIEEIK